MVIFHTRCSYVENILTLLQKNVGEEISTPTASTTNTTVTPVKAFFLDARDDRFPLIYIAIIRVTSDLG